jgi:rhodanese-related sulfurtransferase
METGFDALIAEDGQEFKLGNNIIKLLHTPGHTTESSSYLLLDENGKQHSLFSGDTLFIGDVGRPDLAQKVIAELTQDKLARMLFHSLRDKIMPLDDDVIVYPGHGAGSACGKNMSSETSDTLGNQKRTNYALRANMTEEEFVEELLNGLTQPPAYFPQNVLMNIQGYESIDSIVKDGTKPLTVSEFEVITEETKAVIIDTRDQSEFVKGFIDNSIFIGLDGSFASWAGTVLKDVKTPIVFIADKGREEEVSIRLARIGFDNTLGYLEGGVEAWAAEGKAIQTLPSISPKQLAELYSTGNTSILDIRRKSEFDSQHIDTAENVPLDYLEDNLAKIDKDKTYHVHCAGGYRSVIFSSILKAKGYDNLINVEEGFKGIEATGKFKMTDYVCPTTML